MKNNNIIFDLYLSGKEGNVPDKKDIEEVEEILPMDLNELAILQLVKCSLPSIISTIKNFTTYFRK